MSLKTTQSGECHQQKHGVTAFAKREILPICAVVEILAVSIASISICPDEAASIRRGGGVRVEIMTYTTSEKRALEVIIAEIDKHTCCRLSHLQVARRAGVGRTTVRSAITKATSLGALTVYRRQEDGMTNIIRRT